MDKRIGRVLGCALGLVVVARGAPGAEDPRDVRRIEITASRFEFVPPQIEARRGETVELVVRSADTEHGLAIKAFGVKMTVPKGGAAVTARFVADRAGRFPFVCSEWCGSGHRRMRGELVVTEATQ